MRAVPLPLLPYISIFFLRWFPSFPAPSDFSSSFTRSHTTDRMRATKLLIAIGGLSVPALALPQTYQHGPGLAIPAKTNEGFPLVQNPIITTVTKEVSIVSVQTSVLTTTHDVTVTQTKTVTTVSAATIVSTTTLNVGSTEAVTAVSTRTAVEGNTVSCRSSEPQAPNNGGSQSQGVSTKVQNPVSEQSTTLKLVGDRWISTKPDTAIPTQAPTARWHPRQHLH